MLSRMPSRVAAGSRRRLYSSLWEAFFSVGGLWEGDCPEVSWSSLILCSTMHSHININPPFRRLPYPTSLAPRQRSRSYPSPRSSTSLHDGNGGGALAADVYAQPSASARRKDESDWMLGKNHDQRDRWHLVRVGGKGASRGWLVVTGAIGRVLASFWFSALMGKETLQENGRRKINGRDRKSE